MIFFLGYDHAGKNLGMHIKDSYPLNCVNVCNPEVDTHIRQKGYVDYPDVVSLCVERNTQCAPLILICGTGIGMCMAANRYKHLRAALCHDVETTRLCREHNNANVLVFSQKICPNNALSCINVFLHTAFAGERHARRLEKLDMLQQNKSVFA